MQPPAPAATEPATLAWKSILELVGWGGRRPPRFPTVAMRHGLAPKQMGVLWRLAPGQELPMRALAESLYCDASYVTDLVDRLEDRLPGDGGRLGGCWGRWLHAQQVIGLAT